MVVGSTAGTTRMIVDKLRAKGVKAGMVRVRVFRPFPHAAYAKALEHVKVVGVMDRADSFGAQGGPLFLEIRAALYDNDPRPQVLPFIYGWAGATSSPTTSSRRSPCSKQAAQSKKRASTERRYLNLRED